MGKWRLSVAGAPLSFNGKGFDAKSNACLFLDEIDIEIEKEVNSREADGMIVPGH